MRFRSPVVILVLLGYCLARPENIIDEIEELYTEIGALANDVDSESNKEPLLTEEKWQEDSAIDRDPEIQAIAERDYETPMGRIIAVNLAHWRKRQQKRTEQAQKDKLEFPGNVQENIEMANEENGFFFDQGDMIMDCELYEELHPGKSCKWERRGETRTKRNAIRARKRLWTSRVIPYRVPQYMSHITNNLLQAIGNIQRSTCLQFVPYTGHNNYIEFGNSNGCSSRVGKRYAEAGRQTISIGDGCNHVGTITHELLHALGFFHEQARGDRNQFIEIKWENILNGFSDQFDKYTYKTIEMIGKDYDFRSIMHYDRKAFTKNGLDTIERIDQSNVEFGMPDQSMSPLDIVELNTLYDCQTKNYGWTRWSAFTPCNEECKKERQRYCYHSGNPKACGGNVNVYGIETQEVKCGRHECPAPVDGHWGRWSDWTKCDAQCDNGKRKRIRVCDNPQKKHSGKDCPGNSVEEEVCITKRCHLGFDDTDFETGMGMWRNTGKIQWRRNKFFTQTMDTGPTADHTTGRAGYYLYMESSFPAKAGNRAIIESPWLTAPKGGQCMKLFYSMYGKTIGSLSVVLQTEQYVQTIFRKTGEQGINWNGARASLDVHEGRKFKIKIIAQVGKPGYSDIAIDDVYIDPGLCSCQDDFVSCSKWKADGECNKNVKFMTEHCARSCDTCECKDNNANCPGWAAQPNGCENNRVYMRAHCQKSCKVCSNKGPTMCKDNNKQCPGWAKMGECAKNPLFMNTKCALSCGICVCKDKNSRCPEWSQKEQCIKNKNWMFDNCARSCHVCACGDNHWKCGLWARNGECVKNKVFMEEQCKKSCAKC